MRVFREWFPLVILLCCMGADSTTSNTADAAGLLREFGFPVFVSLWFMWRVEKRFDRFTETIQSLLTAVTVMAKTVDGLPSGRATTSPHTRED